MDSVDPNGMDVVRAFCRGLTGRPVRWEVFFAKVASGWSMSLADKGAEPGKPNQSSI
jgi:hypothetical protein